MHIQDIFNKRTCYNFTDQEISIDLLKEIYDITKLGPSSANSSPLRIIFVRSKAEKAKLLSCIAPGNIEKTQGAVISAILAYDLEFYKYMDKLFPHNLKMQKLFESNKALAYDTAYRNSSLQAAYFMIVARAKGLACGPMSGFDTDKLNKTFFDNTSLRVNFICNLGYEAQIAEWPRGPRLSFDESCSFI